MSEKNTEKIDNESPAKKRERLSHVGRHGLNSRSGVLLSNEYEFTMVAHPNGDVQIVENVEQPDDDDYVPSREGTSPKEPITIMYVNPSGKVVEIKNNRI